MLDIKYIYIYCIYLSLLARAQRPLLVSTHRLKATRKQPHQHDNMARHGDDMTTKWQQHGDEMTAMWRPCGGDVAAIWQQCGGDVAAMRHRRHVVAMSLSRRRHVVVVSSRCRCYVVVMSSWCRRPVVVMLSPFHRNVVTMSTPPLPIRPAMDPPVPTGRLCRQSYRIYLIYIKSYWLNHSNDQILIWIISVA